MSSSEPRGSHSIVEDVFLTGVLERRVGRLDADRIKLNGEDYIRQAPSFDFVWSKISTEEPQVVSRLIRMGFELVATEVQFELPVGRSNRSRMSPSPRIREVTQDDEADVVRIATRAFHDDRFHRDSRIGANAAAAVKGAWASNFFSGSRGDRMFVAMDGDGAVAGFIQLIDSDSTTVIDLVAVAPEAQGCGLGAALVAAAAESAGPRTHRVLVGTQITNAASLRLYAQSGFSLVSSSHVLHGHQTHDGAPG